MTGAAAAKGEGKGGRRCRGFLAVSRSHGEAIPKRLAFSPGGERAIRPGATARGARLGTVSGPHTLLLVSDPGRGGRRGEGRRRKLSAPLIKKSLSWDAAELPAPRGRVSPRPGSSGAAATAPSWAAPPAAAPMAQGTGGGGGGGGGNPEGKRAGLGHAAAFPPSPPPRPSSRAGASGNAGGAAAPEEEPPALGAHSASRERKSCGGKRGRVCQGLF